MKKILLGILALSLFVSCEMKQGTDIGELKTYSHSIFCDDVDKITVTYDENNTMCIKKNGFYFLISKAKKIEDCKIIISNDAKEYITVTKDGVPIFVGDDILIKIYNN